MSVIESEIYGMSAAARFLKLGTECIARHADSGRLPCVRDTSNKRLFLRKDLEQFKRNHHDVRRKPCKNRR